MLAPFMKQISRKSRVQNASKMRSKCVQTVCGYFAKYPHGFNFSTNLHLGENLSKSEPIDNDPPNFIPHMILKMIHIGCIYPTTYVPKGWDQACRSSKIPLTQRIRRISFNMYKDLLNLYTRFFFPATLKPQG